MFLSNIISRQNTISQLSRAFSLTLQTRRRASCSSSSYYSDLHDPHPDYKRSPKYSKPKPSRKKRIRDDDENKKRTFFTPPTKPTLDRVGVKRPKHSNLPFEFRFSYTEVVQEKPIRFREQYSPFGPGQLDREWNGLCAPAAKSPKAEAALAARRKELWKQIQGEDLTKEEKARVLETCRNTKRLINLGRNGLTHNMLDVIQNHLSLDEAVRIRCVGVPTVDMKNVQFQLEDKTFGKIIRKNGGLVTLYRGRNYKPKTKLAAPFMLWRPSPPVYPPLIRPTIEGLSKEESKEMRKRGLALPVLTKLARNAYYGGLVTMIREAFQFSDLLRIDCQALLLDDHKKIGRKLKDLVPCILVSFNNNQIVIWKGKGLNP